MFSMLTSYNCKKYRENDEELLHHIRKCNLFHEQSSVKFIVKYRTTKLKKKRKIKIQ